MSSAPPNMPGGGGAPPPWPPCDSKTQWRIYREQQQAYRRAQRDAWKAQGHAWKAHYAGIYGPRVPSLTGPLLLIAIGVVGLLLYSGRIPAGMFWAWYGQWWPLLLIGAGVLLLAEWALDLRRPTPVRRSGSFVGLIVLLAILGAMAAGWHRMHPWFNWDNRDNDFFSFNTFGLPEHDYDQPSITATVPARVAIDIENPRGDVSVTAGTETTIEVLAHEVAYAGSDSNAGNIFDAEAARVTVSGSAVLIKSQGSDSGRVNLTVTVPEDALVTVNAGRGDVTASGLGAGINVNAAHGDTSLNSIKGQVVAHFAGGNHDFSAHLVEGDITADGNTNDVTLSLINGRITIDGDIFGDVHMEDISGAVKVHTSMTNLEVASLPGDLTLDSDNLRVNEARGAVRVQTRSKDIDLSRIYGDTSVTNRNGSIAVEPAGVYAIAASNSNGNVEITLPREASAIISGRTHNGDIVTDYDLAVSGEEDKTVSGRIGAGAVRITLSTDEGDLRIKKSALLEPADNPASIMHAAPPAPGTTGPAAPKAPDAQSVRHLKSSHAPHEVSQ